MSRNDLWSLLQATTQAFTPHYNEAMQPVLTEFNFQGPDWFMSFAAYGIDPEPLTAVHFHACFPYANIENQKQNLALAAEHGFLETVAPDSYRLTDKGRVGMQRFYADTGAAIAGLEPLPAADMQQLANLFSRIITATEAAEEPAHKPGFLMSRRTDTGRDAPPALRIDQYATDLLRYRDDAHIAAWINHGIDGRTWETLTFLWRDEAHTAAELADHLSNRNYDEAVYATALQNLVQKGWAEETEGAYQITEAGRKMREAAEARTDEYFFVGWSALNDEEQARFETLLQQLHDALNEITAVPA
jgi:DNA-binding PadR family transcriptional regulator